MIVEVQIAKGFQQCDQVQHSNNYAKHGKFPTETDFEPSIIIIKAVKHQVETGKAIFQKSNLKIFRLEKKILKHLFVLIRLSLDKSRFIPTTPIAIQSHF